MASNFENLVINTPDTKPSLQEDNRETLSDIESADLASKISKNPTERENRLNEVRSDSEIFHLQDLQQLAKLRQVFAFKLFRLIKSWLAGAAMFLLFSTVTHQSVAGLLALSLFFGVAYSVFNDKKSELRIKDCPSTDSFLKICFYKSSFYISIICFVLAMSLLLPCLWLPICFDTNKNSVGQIIKASDSVIMTLLTTTTATVIGLFIIAARWLFNSNQVKDDTKKGQS